MLNYHDCSHLMKDLLVCYPKIVLTLNKKKLQESFQNKTLNSVSVSFQQILVEVN